MASPARKQGESFEAFRARRARENERERDPLARERLLIDSSREQAVTQRGVTAARRRALSYKAQSRINSSKSRTQLRKEGLL